jgi:hypothetical protein
MRQALLLAICLPAIGCVNAKVERLDQAIRPVRPPDSVAVLVERPDQPYTVIAVIESSTATLFKGFDDLRAKLVAEAAQLGGEALILGAETTKTGVIFTPTPIFHDRKELTAEVIVYR